MKKLICKRVTFFSAGDELRFFHWIDSIKGILRWEGVSDEIHIYVGSKISKTAKQELVGLFRRYNIPLTQLKKHKLLPDWGDRVR